MCFILGIEIVKVPDSIIWVMETLQEFVREYRGQGGVRQATLTDRMKHLDYRPGEAVRNKMALEVVSANKACQIQCLNRRKVGPYSSFHSEQFHCTTRFTSSHRIHFTSATYQMQR